MRKPSVAALLLATSTVQAWPWSNGEVDKITHSKAFLVTKGVLRGALDAEGFDDVEHCLSDAEDIVQDVEAAYADFKKGHAGDVIAGVKQVGNMLKSLKKALKDCNFAGDIKRLESMGEIFASPLSFAYHVGKDLVVNRVDIFKEIKNAVVDYEASKWEDFGYNIGEAAAQVLIGKESQFMLMSLQPPMLGGTFEGAWGMTVKEELDQDPTDELAGGMSEVHVVDQSENSEVNEKLAGFKTMVEEHLGKKFSQFVPARYSTQTVKGLIYRVEYNVGNGASVFAKILVPPTEVPQSEPFLMTAQEEVASAMDVTPSAPQQPDQHPMLTSISRDGAEELISGLIDAFLKDENLSQIGECIKDSKVVAKDVADIVHDLKKKSIQGTISAVKAMGGLLEELPTEAEACGGMTSDIQRVKEFGALVHKPLTFVKTVTHNIRENHTQIFKDISAAVKSFEAKDYKGTGADIADIMVQTLGEFPPAAPQAPESLVLTQW